MSEEYMEKPPVEMNAVPDAGEKKNNTTKTVVIVLVVVLLLCCIIPICVIAMLTLMGPSIGNVFSDIVTGLEMTPVP